MDQLLRVAANLRNLPLPSVENHGPTARKKTTSRALLPEHVPKLSASWRKRAGRRKKLPSPRKRQLLRPRDPSSAVPAAL